MTSTGYHDTGEEWVQKTTYRQDLIGSRNSTVDVLLYNDDTDSLSDSDDIGAITSEPTSGNYSRRVIFLDGADVPLTDANGDYRAKPNVVFDITNTTEDVTAYAIVVNFKSDLTNDSSANDHLLLSSTFDSGETRDLSQESSFDLTPRIDLS